MTLPWQPFATAKEDGHGVLAYGRHVADNGPKWSAGDHWYAIVVFDLWREPRKWVFAKDGTDLWSEPTHWLDLTPPAEHPPLQYPHELTPELSEILGTMPWVSGNTARVFRAAGTEIRPKCEAEQAYVLHWLTTLALEHGAGWRVKAADRLRELARTAGDVQVAGPESAAS